jgi:hypothetical protein
MESVLDDPSLEDAVIDSQDAALARLQARDFGGTLLRFVDQVIATPARPAPEVAWDFWAQFEQFERFEELRQFRPALFQALPSGLGTRGSGLEGAETNNETSSRAPNHELRTPPGEQRTASREQRK